MARLDTFTLKIKTGKRGHEGSLKFTINGFPLEFDQVTGGTGPGETAEATGSPQSFPHSLTLMGPENGAWDIDAIEATYECYGEEPYSVRFGAVTLEDHDDLNIWHPRPAVVFDV